MIDVMLLGTGAMVPLPTRWLSSVLIRTGSSLMLMDCGEGTQIAMRERHWGFRKLDAVCLSHLHADHVAGIPGLLHTVANAGKTTPLMVVGPAGTSEVIEALRSIAPELPFDVIVHELRSGGEVEGPAGLRTRVAEGIHRVPVIAYRVELPRQPRFSVDAAQRLGVPVADWSRLQEGEAVEIDGRTILPSAVMGTSRAGVSLGFFTDTRPTDAVRDLIAGVDLLICEGTYAEDIDQARAERRGHMTFREAATLARDAGAGHLWLTHFSAGLAEPELFRDNAASIMPAVTIGRAGLSARLSFEGGYQQRS